MTFHLDLDLRAPNPFSIPASSRLSLFHKFLQPYPISRYTPARQTRHFQTVCQQAGFHWRLTRHRRVHLEWRSKASRIFFFTKHFTSVLSISKYKANKKFITFRSFLSSDVNTDEFKQKATNYRVTVWSLVTVRNPLPSGWKSSLARERAREF